MTLRKKLIRLAFENPNIRPHVLPLLKQAGKMRVRIIEAPDDGPEGLEGTLTLNNRSLSFEGKKLIPRANGSPITQTVGFQVYIADRKDVRDTIEILDDERGNWVFKKL